MKLEVDKLKELCYFLYRLRKKYDRFCGLLKNHTYCVWNIHDLYNEGDIEKVQIDFDCIVITDNYDIEYRIPLYFYDETASNIEKFFVNEICIGTSINIFEVENQLEELRKNQTEIIDIQGKL